MEFLRKIELRKERQLKRVIVEQPSANFTFAGNSFRSPNAYFFPLHERLADRDKANYTIFHNWASLIRQIMRINMGARARGRKKFQIKLKAHFHAQINKT